MIIGMVWGWFSLLSELFFPFWIWNAKKKNSWLFHAQIAVEPLIIVTITSYQLVGAWAAPLKSMNVNWDNYSQCMENNMCPNHQPAKNKWVPFQHPHPPSTGTLRVRGTNRSCADACDWASSSRAAAEVAIKGRFPHHKGSWNPTHPTTFLGVVGVSFTIIWGVKYLPRQCLDP